MDLGQVQIAIGIDWRILDGIVRYLYRAGTIPDTIPVQGGGATVNLDEPRIDLLSTADGDEKLALRLQGQFVIGSGQARDFSLAALLAPIVVNQPPDAPTASFSVDGVQDVTPPNMEALFASLAQTLLGEMLQNLSLPIYGPLIDALAPAYFGDVPPPPGQWSLGFSLGRAGVWEREHSEPWRPHSIDVLPVHRSLVVTVALPAEDARIPGDRAITPHGTGLQILVSQAAMNTLLSRGASEQVGQEIEGVKITSLMMAMADTGIEIHGKAKKQGATISWDGTIRLYFHNYYTNIKTGAVAKWLGPFSNDGYLEVATSGIDVDVDMPWYLKFFKGIFFFLGPIGWIINSVVINPKFEEAEEAPNLLRNGLGNQVRIAFTEMVSGLTGISDNEQLPFVMLGSDAWISQGQYAYTFKAFAGYNQAGIERVDYDRFLLPGAEGKSVGFFQLDIGHKLAATEAGMLLKRGVLDIPGYHGVSARYGYYVRANPNQQGDDNLVPPEDIIVH